MRFPAFVILIFSTDIYIYNVCNIRNILKNDVCAIQGWNSMSRRSGKPQGEILITRNITITLEQDRILKQNPQINVSGLIRKWLDEYFIKEKLTTGERKTPLLEGDVFDKS